MISYLKSNQIITRKTDEGYFLIPIIENAADMQHAFLLDEVGGFIWENLDKTNNFETLVKQVISEYDISEENAKTDLKEFLEILEKNNLIKKIDHEKEV